MFKFIKDKRDQFEAWVASMLPGWKTKLVALIGGLSMAAISMQDMITGLPIEQFVSPIKLALINGGLFLLVYWTKRLSD